MYDSDSLAAVLFTLFCLMFIGLVALVPCIKWQSSEELVSGIVYNTQTNKAFTNNTTFSVRAAVDTVVTEENASSYCLPPDSKYIKLIQEAAADKSVKVVVSAHKFFGLRAPWTCVDNVTVLREVK